ncbi:hypothetical protein ACWGHM_28675 [Streptomyces sp. NPDC054904]|uniref:hypothetical protein n=1 Tax=unclassified Streptomyces TaxID=2593676 RepID=UPI002481EF04|nr:MULTISPECIES: hypothetical protein [unclassified Streptomyces]MDA5284489.1 hypothetical protein [Streptomyces sp. Isolate_45]MDX2390777.1 hypothetical protein [Streptomyces sp. DK15]
MAQRKGCLIGCGVALVVGVGLAVALVLGGGKLLDIADKTLLDPKVYEAVRIGDNETEVRAKLPSGDSFVKEALKDGGPAEPTGSTCAWYLSSTDNSSSDVLRLCFKDGKLADKAAYRMK